MTTGQRAPDSDLETLTLGLALRLEELVARESLTELVRSMYALFGIPVRVFAGDGTLLADASTEQPLCHYVNTLRQGASACSQTVLGAKRKEPDAHGDATHACFSGAVYRVVAIDYDGRRLGKAILGPYLAPEVDAAPSALLAVDPALDPTRARELLLRMPRAREDAVALIADHLRCALDLILFAGHKALLTSQMHLATVRESYRELSEKNQRLQEAFDRLKELDRLKSNFLGTVSHELRTPLTSIIGYSEMLGEGIAGPLQDEQKDFVQTIRDKGEQLLVLISGLLDMSKLESGTMSLRRTRTDLEGVLEDAVATLLPLARKRSIEVVLEVEGALPELRADGERLRQVFLNLIDNAMKFSGERSTVRLTARTVAFGDGPEEDEGLSLLAPARQAIEVRVADRGIGIAPDVRSRVFDPFYQVDSSSTREYGGAGLGLSIVKRLVEAHGGTVFIEPNDPSGTVFVVTIPIEVESQPK